MAKTMIKIFFLIVFILNWLNPVFCQENNNAPLYTSDTDAALEAELRWLRAEAVILTDIATKTRMDADIVPGIVSVADGREMEKRGIRTVWDALSLMPGIDAFRHRAVMRGIGHTSSVNIKALLNGAPVNSVLDGSFNALY